MSSLHWIKLQFHWTVYVPDSMDLWTKALQFGTWKCCHNFTFNKAGFRILSNFLGGELWPICRKGFEKGSSVTNSLFFGKKFSKLFLKKLPKRKTFCSRFGKWIGIGLGSISDFDNWNKQVLDLVCSPVLGHSWSWLRLIKVV